MGLHLEGFLSAEWRLVGRGGVRSYAGQGCKDLGPDDVAGSKEVAQTSWEEEAENVGGRIM